MSKNSIESNQEDLSIRISEIEDKLREIQDESSSSQKQQQKKL